MWQIFEGEQLETGKVEKEDINAQEPKDCQETGEGEREIKVGLERQTDKKGGEFERKQLKM